MATRTDVERLIKAFGRRRLLVVGDLMLDRYVSGTAGRLSPEAPVPVVQVTREEARPGGAANVAANIRSLGGQVLMAGVVGRDAAGLELSAILRAQGVGPAAVITDPRVRTTVKTRVLAERQQVVRIDHETLEGLPAATIAALCRRLRRVVPTVDGVIIEDYAKGVVCQPVIDAILSAAPSRSILIGLDPKDNRALTFGRLSLATPNFAEACAAAGLPHRPLGEGDPCRHPVLVQAGEILSRRWNCDLLIITLGSHGMYLVAPGEPPRHIPTEAREVFDVSGAGDTVIATAMLALAAGANHRLAATLANVAAGVVVGKVGTATCTANELRAQWRVRAAEPPTGGAAAAVRRRPSRPNRKGR